MAHDLIFFPDYRVANPYQRLLYGHAGTELHPRPGTVTDALTLLRRKGDGSRVIFHLHWEDAAYRNEADEAQAWAAAQAFLSELELFADAGGRILWTLHNTASHDGRWLDVHEALVGRLPQLVDLVHVHSHAAAAWAADRLGVDPARIAIVPHGNYLPLYHPMNGSAAGVRTRIGLPEDGRVLLLFGRLGAYKGAETLLEALAALDAPDLHLVVAGREVDPLEPLLARLPAPVLARIHCRTGNVSEEDVEPLFAAADAVVLPYRSILTSGTAFLALSLRRPVIAPAFPSLRELLEDGSDALLYPPDDPAGLADALSRFCKLSQEQLRAMQASAYDKALRHDWRQSGLLLAGLFHLLLRKTKPQRLGAAASGG
jgi:glycosyltransferase involved in cell wall biosynthesis